MITPIRSSLIRSLFLIVLVLSICTPIYTSFARADVARAEGNQDASWCVSGQVAASIAKTQRPAGEFANPLFLPMVAMLGNLPAPPRPLRSSRRRPVWSGRLRRWRTAIPASRWK